VREDWPEQADAIFAASVHEAPLWLRVNRRHGTRDAYRQRLLEAGIAAEPVEGVADALVLDTPVAPTALPGFADGDVSVQDGAAQRVADVFHDLLPDARVLDMCSAPGGKTAHLLEREPSLHVLALDVDERRLQRVRDTLSRVGVEAQLRAADAADTASWWDGQLFDAVLLDAPCSATGIVRRQPDVLLHRRPEDLAALVRLQTRLLDAAWRVLRPGGVLVYATCSILACENTMQIESFRRRSQDAVLEELPAGFGRQTAAGVQRFPGEQAMAGFFYAVMRKA
jgi:16S rRNA (cytosine967-C5)-methyltransferase